MHGPERGRRHSFSHYVNLLEDAAWCRLVAGERLRELAPGPRSRHSTKAALVGAGGEDCLCWLFTKTRPAPWVRLQIVISTKVVNGVSGPPAVVATHFW